MVSYEAGILGTPLWAYLVAAVFSLWVYSKLQSKIAASFLTVLFFLGVVSDQWLLIAVVGLIVFLMGGIPHGFLLKNITKESGGLKTREDMMKEREEAMQIARDAQTEEYNSQMMKQLYKGYGWVESY